MRQASLRRTLVLTTPILAAACTRDDAPTADYVLNYEGVTPVINTSAPPPARLDLVVSIGPKTLTDSGSPEEFGRVSSVAIGPNEEVFVADDINHEVRVFGLDGAHHRTFGREGEGPGEFNSLNSVAWAGDRLLTFDPDLGRIGEWSTEGEWLGQRATRAGVTGVPASVRLYGVGPDEAFHFALLGPDLQRFYVGHDSRGETGDTLAWMQAPPIGRPAIVCEFEDRIAFFPIPFAPRFLQHPGPGGVLYSALSSDYRIFVTRSDGAEVLMVIERPLPIESFSTAEWRAANAEYYEWRENRSDASCDPRNPARPDARPFIEDLFVAPDGKLWVEVVRAAGNRWEVFDSEGSLLASVPAPPRRTEHVAPAFGPDYLLTIRRDSLDLDHVDVWRLERGN